MVEQQPDLKGRQPRRRAHEPDLKSSGTVVRTLGLVRMVAELGEMSIKDLSMRMGLAPSTVHRLLQTFTEAGIIEHDPKTKRYRVGPELANIGMLVSNRSSIKDLARPFLRMVVDTCNEACPLDDLHNKDCTRTALSGRAEGRSAHPRPDLLTIGECDEEVDTGNNRFTPQRPRAGILGGAESLALRGVAPPELALHGISGGDFVDESQARLTSAIDLVGLSPYTWNPATGVLDWDARLKAMWGLPPDAPVDQGVFLSGIHPEDRPRVEATIAQCSDPAGPGIYAIEYRVIGIEDGAERWVSTHGRCTFEQGRPVAFIGAALDITERKRSETALRESEERFRQFADNSSNTLWILNFETMNLEYLSPAFEPVWGEPPEGVLGDPNHWSRFLHPDDRQRARGALERVKLGDTCTEEFRIVRQDRTVRWIRNTFFPIRDAVGQIRQAGGIAQDITRHDGRFVYVVDAEETTLSHLLRDAGYRVTVFSSGKSFLDAAPALAAGCVVLDICRSGAGGLVIPRELKARRIGLPVIVLGDPQGDVTFGVQVMKAGAADFLPIPFGSDQLLAAVASAAASTRDDEQNQETDRARLRIAEMSERERQVLAGLLAGKTNKEIGREIGLSPRTVETHRARVMQRLGVQTLSQAVLVAISAGFQPPSPGPNVSHDSSSSAP